MAGHIEEPGRIDHHQCKRETLAFFRSGAHFDAGMNSKQRRTLEAVFTDPVSGTIEWVAIESLLVAVGCQTIEGKGSAVKFVLEGFMVRFHRPHPGKEAKPYQVKDARLFLRTMGIQP